MKKKLSLLNYAVIACILFADRSEAQTFSPQLATMLQDTLNYYVSAITNVKGMSAGVYLPGQGLWQGTAGVSYAGQPITNNMEFGIASNTKLFVSAAMLKLVDNNILSLNDSLKKWLPPYVNINPNITIRQLLNHTSGVQDPFGTAWMDTIMKYPNRVFTPTEVLSWVGPPLFAPGTNWSYSNVNYILAGMIAESATGIHISKIIRDSVLTPLGLSHTFYDVKEPVIGTLAHRWYNNIDYNDTSRVGLNTAGGCAGAIFSTSEDMTKWYSTLFTGQLLKPASFAELTNFIPTPQAYTYGLGLEKQNYFGHTTWGHGGTTWGYKSRMVYDPCMGAVVCGLANSWPAGMDGITLLLYSVVVNHVPNCAGSISGPSSVCLGQQNVVYTVPPITNATSYIWTLPSGATGTSTTNTITVSFGSTVVAGNISVRGNSTYGVGAASVLPVVVNALPSATITAMGPTSFCSGGSVILQAPVAANISYQWKKGTTLLAGATLSYYTATVGGNYKVTTTNTLTGCSRTTATAKTVTVYALPSATITALSSTTFCAGDSVVLSANAGTGLTYQWIKGVNLLAAATSQNYTARVGGSYKVRVTNTYNCTKISSAKIVTVNCRQGNYEMDAPETKIFPNPAHDIISINLECKKESTAIIVINDTEGRAVLKQEEALLPGTTELNINLSGLRNGVYFVHVMYDNRQAHHKIIKL